MMARMPTLLLLMRINNELLMITTGGNDEGDKYCAKNAKHVDHETSHVESDDDTYG